MLMAYDAASLHRRACRTTGESLLELADSNQDISHSSMPTFYTQQTSAMLEQEVQAPPDNPETSRNTGVTLRMPV